MPYSQIQPNEMRPELASVHAINSFIVHNSPSRSVMMSGHISQHVVIAGSEPQRTQSGVADEMGLYTMAVKMPANGRIIQAIARYPQGVGEGSLQFNPETLIIYENDETKEIDCFVVPYHSSYHQFFGYRNEMKEAMSHLVPNTEVAAGTVFADTPANKEFHNYSFGRNMNVALMSVPGVAEDGIIISEDALKHYRFHVYETRTAELGSKDFLLNLHGGSKEFKPFPDIGDFVREDGILLVTREYDPDLAPVDMGINDVQNIDYTFDKALYAREGTGATKDGMFVSNGRIVDIKVVTNNDTTRNLPPAMSGQLDKYAKALRKYYQDIMEVENRLTYERKRKFGEARLKISPRFQNLLVEARAILNHQPEKMKGPLNLIYRRAPLDEYSVTFVVEYEITPNIGFKLTGVSGDKGVICKIEKPENMPVDAAGNRADIIMSSDSTCARTNWGRLYEQYFGGAARDVTKNIKALTGLDHTASMYKVESLDPKVFAKAYDYLMGYYKLISPRQHHFFNLEISNEDKIEHLYDVLKAGVYNDIPIDNPLSTPHMVKDVESFIHAGTGLGYRPTYGPISYVGPSGRRVTTKDNVRIGPLYIMLLDKIADDWSSTSTGKLQHYGVLSPQTRVEKFSTPFRNSPVRTIGETEGRIFAGYCGVEAIAEMLDRSNNPLTQRNINWNILTADKPSNIDTVVDREYIPLGSTRPLQLVKHIFSCSGFIPQYIPESESVGAFDDSDLISRFTQGANVVPKEPKKPTIGKVAERRHPVLSVKPDKVTPRMENVLQTVEDVELDVPDVDFDLDVERVESEHDE